MRYFPLMTAIDRVLAIDVDSRLVRGIVLTNTSPAQADGYAQLAFDTPEGAATVAARIAGALDVRTALPVVLVCHQDSPAGLESSVRRAVERAGFDIIATESRQTSADRSNPGGGAAEALVDTQIAEGLLSSHEGLTLTQLAPVVGAALGVLRLGAPDQPGAGMEDPLAMDPFAGQPAVADEPPLLDEDLTMPASASVREALLAQTRKPDEPVADTPADPQLPDDVTVAAAGAFDAQIPGRVPTAAEMDETVVMDAAATAARAQLPDDATIARPNPGPETKRSARADDAAAAFGAAGDVDFGGERSKQPLLLALGALLLVGLAALLISQCGGSDGDSTTSASTGAAAEQSAADTPAVRGEPTSDASAQDPAPTATEVPEPTATAEPDPTPTVEPTSVPEPEPAPAVEPEVDVADLPPLSSLPERGAVFRPPTLFLEGPVQTQEQADQLYQAAIAVVGPDNVVNNYVVRPDAPQAIDGNIRVEQAVLFESGSAVIAEEFIPTLELGVAVMGLNPQVTVRVEGHTDSLGAAASNQSLSERRAESVGQYLIDRGVAADRVIPVGFGETEPVATNDTDDGRRLNRRIEFELLDLLSTE